jgi:hypothetical protein
MRGGRVRSDAAGAPGEREVARLGGCGPQPAHGGARLKSNDKQVWAGTPVDQTAWRERGKHQAAGRAPARCPSRHRHRFLFIVSRIAIVRPAGVRPPRRARLAHPLPPGSLRHGTSVHHRPCRLAFAENSRPAAFPGLALRGSGRSSSAKTAIRAYGAGGAGRGGRGDCVAVSSPTAGEFPQSGRACPGPHKRGGRHEGGLRRS